MSNHKERYILGLFWSFIDSVAGQGITFIAGIILARLLSPDDFGLIGMLTIFIALSQTFIDSGFRQALIRKQNCTDADYSTIFYFNVIAGILFYFILFFSAGSISNFFNEPILKEIIRVLGLAVVINSFSIIQSALLIKKIDFKTQAKISVMASLLAGTISIYLAYTGWGVWSLVMLTIFKYFINTVLLWFVNKWRPLWYFSIVSFKELFSFSSKILISGIIDTVYRNVYYLVIGRYFSSSELGFYTRADQFKNLPSQNLNNIVSKVSYPVLSTMQDNTTLLKETYKKIIRSTMLVTFVLMLGMAAAAKPLVISLVGEKWEPSIIYLEMLCFVGIFYPLQALNLNMLQVKGRSDLFLRLEIIKKLLAIPIIVIGVIWGIKVMITGMILNSVIAYLLNSFWSGRLIGYSTFEQIKDILPSFILGITMSVIVFLLGKLLPIPYLYILPIQIIAGAIIVIGLSELFRFGDYQYIKQILYNRFLQ
jgi:O-antigen/teichoic acid export membrane protein